MRIALFSGNYNCVRDGANKALNRLVEYLLEQGAAVRVYSPTAARPAFEPAGTLVSVPSIGIPGRPEYRLALGLTPAMRADLRRFAPTHVHLSAPDLLGRAAQRFARKLGATVIASLHTRFETYLDYYRLGILRPIAERTLKSFYLGCDRLLAPNQPMAGWLRDIGLADRTSIWGRGVDHQLFSPARRDTAWRRAHGYADEDVIPMFFGRLVLEKGLDVFAEVIAQLRSRGHMLRPLIVGDGPARSFLAQRLPNATFTGHLEGDALARAVASADILVNPSVTEAFGNVNLEAMAAGVAIVSADVGSARSLIRSPRIGVLVPPDQPSRYAEQIEHLIHAPGRRRSLGFAAAAAAQRYAWPDILGSVMNVYLQSHPSHHKIWPAEPGTSPPQAKHRTPARL
jgi:glycosyltransferase involved in cell wall biosynthesis